MNVKADPASNHQSLAGKPHPDARLTRAELARALTEAGFPTKAATLATKASRGGGPPYRYWGSRAIYSWADGLAWAMSRLSTRRGSTSEHATNCRDQ
jgi:hypothetical protein